MPVIQLYHHGFTGGVPPSVNDHPRAKRSTVGGWSPVSIRSNTRFLYSVLENELTGLGFALTLTVRDCPPTSDDWHKLRRRFEVRLRRMGMIRMHWVTEWQRRGVPHLHCAVWFPDPGRSGYTALHSAIFIHWLKVAAPYMAGAGGQHIKPITDSIGWFQYLSKHAARGLSHYQRSPEGTPPAWLSKTGRMWGKIGDWPTREAIRIELDTDGFHAFRRIVRRWRISQARLHVKESGAAPEAITRLLKARTLLKCPERKLSSVRGVSEWMEIEDQLRMVAAVAAMGYTVQH